MDGMRNQSKRKYDYLDRLSIEKLEELLRRSMGSSKNQEISEYYDAIEEAILRKEQQSPSGRLSDVDASWEEFQKHYATSECDVMHLYPELETDNGKEAPSTKTSRFVPRKNRFFKKAILVAAVAAVLFASMIVAQAAGLDIFGRLAQWTNEVFHFELDYSAPTGREEDLSLDSPNEIYNAIQAEVKKCGISVPVVPTWFPSGYKLQEVSYQENEIVKAVYCLLTNQEEDRISFEVSNYENAEQLVSHSIEKDDRNVEEYVSNDQRYYIMENSGTMVTAWSTDTWCVTIDGTFSVEDAKTMADSIGG